ncbi:LysR family transcriptional regulator [Inquilinus sp.]|jgi:DNA-binding transcriptional LysR family regulator|uniref:LysR family transcriptional regulator n=1 Tax=Inquilinus sp. TaxID=1932117 RepID=UPI0037848247
MELSWLEDFLALAECGSFSRAAERRNMTQPAFSRRIKALEDWVGAGLVDRGTHRIALTAAGERFRPVADETIRRLQLGREAVREVASASTSTLRFAATHALSLTFFPAWLRGLQLRGGLDIAVRLTADTMQACEKLMLQGRAQFLLCHHHPAAATALEPAQFLSLRLGGDVLLPVSAPANEGQGPLHALPGTAERPVPHLAYGESSGMGRIVAATRALDGPPAHLAPGFASHAAMVLAAMARDRRGVAWLPLSLVEADLAAGTLVRAGDEAWDIPIEIRLHRPRARQAPAAEAFWSMAAG